MARGRVMARCLTCRKSFPAVYPGDPSPVTLAAAHRKAGHKVRAVKSTRRSNPTGYGAGVCPSGHALHWSESGDRSRAWCQVCGRHYPMPRRPAGTVPAFVADVRATSGRPLLGGVRVHTSYPFTTESLARRWADTVMDTNRAAGRPCSVTIRKVAARTPIGAADNAPRPSSCCATKRCPHRCTAGDPCSYCAGRGVCGWRRSAVRRTRHPRAARRGNPRKAGGSWCCYVQKSLRDGVSHHPECKGRRRNPEAWPCAYCGGPGGDISGPGHALHCSRYVKRPRRVGTITSAAYRKRKRAASSNPPRGRTLIYPDGRIVGTWYGRHRNGRLYKHRFGHAHARIYGNADGSITIEAHRGRLWEMR